MEILTLLGIACVLATVSGDAGLEVTPRRSTVFLKKGGDIVLTCVSRRDYITLSWETPSGFLKDHGFKDSKVEYSVDGSVNGVSAELKIVNYQIPGTYTCVAKTDKDKDKSSSTQEVVETYPIEFYTVTEEVQDAVFDKEVEEVTLSCKISADGVQIGDPVWKQNHTLVKELETDKTKFVTDVENLKIIGVMRSYAAMYTAEYTLKVGSKNSTQYRCNVPLKAGPLVLDFEKSKNLIEDENLELNCKILGYPAPMVKWMKDGNDLESNPRITMQDYDGVKNATLKIRNVVFDDAGDYTCFASSEELNSTNSKDITVRVKDRYAALWPFIGIVGEVIVLCTFIFIYEKRRSRQAEQEDAGQDEADGSATDKSEGLRHRNTTANNPRA